jgi:hypothetical protein
MTKEEREKLREMAMAVINGTPETLDLAAAYIFAARPKVILNLLDENEKWEKLNEMDACIVEGRNMDALRAKLEIAEKALEFYAQNDIHSVDFNYLDNGEIAREYFHSKRMGKK